MYRYDIDYQTTGNNSQCLLPLQGKVCSPELSKQHSYTHKMPGFAQTSFPQPDTPIGFKFYCQNLRGRSIQPSKYETSNRCRLNDGPPSLIPARHQIIIGSTSSVCWGNIHIRQTEVNNRTCACVQVHMRRTYLCIGGSSSYTITIKQIVRFQERMHLEKIQVNKIKNGRLSAIIHLDRPDIAEYHENRSR